MCVCFGGKWFQEIIFPQTRMFGSNRKWNFPEIHFLLTKIYAFDPEMILHSHFHFKSFPGHAKHRESERKNNTERARTRMHHPTQPTSERKNQNSDPAIDIDLPHAGHAELSQTITAPNAADPRWVRAQTHTDPDQHTRSSSASRSPIQPLRSPSQTQTHGEFSGTGWLSTHSPHLRSTHSPHRSNPSSRPTSRSDLCIIYIYIYINIYIFIYFFLFINFFNYPCFIKLCIYGLCIWNFGAFLVAGYSGLVFGLIFF